jgi:hypothetical protein
MQITAEGAARIVLQARSAVAENAFHQMLKIVESAVKSVRPENHAAVSELELHASTRRIITITAGGAAISVQQTPIV